MNNNVQNPVEGQVPNGDNSTDFKKYFELAPTPPEGGQSEEDQYEMINEEPTGEDNPQNIAVDTTSSQENTDDTDDVNNETEEDFDKWDKEKAVKAYRNLQRKLTERDKLAKELMREKLFLEEQLKVTKGNVTKQLQPEEEQEDSLPEPIVLPPDFDYTEAFTNPHSKEAELLRKREQYFNRLGEYFQKELERKKQQEQAKKQKQWFISQAYKELNDPKSAEDMYNWFMEIIQKDDFKTLSKAYQLLKQGQNSNTKVNPTQAQTKQTIIPPAVNSGANNEEPTGGIYQFDYSKIFELAKKTAQ